MQQVRDRPLRCLPEPAILNAAPCCLTCLTVALTCLAGGGGTTGCQEELNDCE